MARTENEITRDTTMLNLLENILNTLNKVNSSINNLSQDLQECTSACAQKGKK